MFLQPALPALFEAQAARTPDACAVRDHAGALTYAELNVRANRLARRLIADGAGPERLVAVALPRSPELVVALLAVLKAGAAYLPIDLDYPEARVSAMLVDARPTAVVSRQGFAEAAGAVPVRLDDPATAGEVEWLPASDVTDADRLGPLSPLNPAYVIYTSGTTGTPKGVVIEHRALTDYLMWTMRSYHGPRAVSVVPTSIAFDLTVTGLYTTLVVGGCVHLLSMPAHHPVDVDLLGRTAGTFLKVTPSHLPMLTELPLELSPTVELLLGGEALTGAAVDQWRRRRPQATVLNVYGPTEATVNCAEFRIEPGQALDPGPVPIGAPQGDARLYVLDEDLAPVGPGGVGTLFIAGSGLARGYLRQPTLTAPRFLPDPFGPPGERMYRTGDLVRRNEDGNLVFVGRVDDQVKIRGHRVELGEVEAVLAQCDAVAEVACAVRAAAADGPALAAFVVLRPGAMATPADLRRWVGQRLPGHMVPSTVVLLDRLPRAPNGKISRAALPVARETTPGPGAPDGDRFGPVLRLRSGGTGHPLFCLHSASGLGWAYRRIASSIVDRPVVAVQAPWLRAPDRCPASLDELASTYLAEIQRVQSAGPYHLLGWGFGGRVAHAVATRLQAAGERVPLLTVVSPDPDAAGPAADVADLLASLRRSGAGGDTVGPPWRLAQLDDVLAVVRVWRDCTRLADSFVPQPFAGDLRLIHTAGTAQPANAWAGQVTGRLDVSRADPDDLGPMIAEGLGALEALGRQP